MKKINYLFFILFAFILFACRDDFELTMERGIYFYKQGDVNKAMQEFNDVIFSLSDENMSSNDRILLARAYYNLGLSYSKLEQYNRAINNMENAIALDPKQEYLDTIELIYKKMQ